jgi:hypothetical protein
MYSSTSTKSKNLQHESCVKQQDQATLKIKFQMEKFVQKISMFFHETEEIQSTEIGVHG